MDSATEMEEVEYQLADSKAAELGTAPKPANAAFKKRLSASQNGKGAKRKNISESDEEESNDSDDIYKQPVQVDGTAEADEDSLESDGIEEDDSEPLVIVKHKPAPAKLSPVPTGNTKGKNGKAAKGALLGTNCYDSNKEIVFELIIGANGRKCGPTDPVELISMESTSCLEDLEIHIRKLLDEDTAPLDLSYRLPWGKATRITLSSNTVYDVMVNQVADRLSGKAKQTDAYHVRIYHFLNAQAEATKGAKGKAVLDKVSGM